MNYYFLNLSALHPIMSAQNRNISIHSHIKSLGKENKADSNVVDNGSADASNGTSTTGPGTLFGQKAAREGASLIVQMLRSRRIAGRAVLVYGPSGCGKSALTVAIEHEMNFNFVRLSGAEIGNGFDYGKEESTDVDRKNVPNEKMERNRESGPYSARALSQKDGISKKGPFSIGAARDTINNFSDLFFHARRAISVKFKEIKKVYEGEITSIRLKDYAFQIDLRSAKGVRTVCLHPSMYESVRDEELGIGDVVYIEPVCGIIKKVGRVETAFEFDIECGKAVALPKKDAMRKRIVAQRMSLYDIDMAEETSDEIRNTLFHILGAKNVKLRTFEETDTLLSLYVANCAGEVNPGILCIDDCHLIDGRTAQQLIQIMDAKMSPLVLLVTNERKFLERGDVKELVSRAMVIRMENEPGVYADILRARAKECGVSLMENALEKLEEIGKIRGLKRALSLLNVMEAEVGTVDVGRLDELYEF